VQATETVNPTVCRLPGPHRSLTMSASKAGVRFVNGITSCWAVAEISPLLGPCQAINLSVLLGTRSRQTHCIRRKCRLEDLPSRYSQGYSGKRRNCGVAVAGQRCCDWLACGMAAWRLPWTLLASCRRVLLSQGPPNTTKSPSCCTPSSRR
jgi:hypothetical protein